MLKSHNSVAHDLTHVQFIDSETESFTEEPLHEYVAQCPYPFVALRVYTLNK